MQVLRTMIVPVLLLASGVVPAGADTLPASVRACIGLADATERLACYDREVARLIAPAGTFAAGPGPSPTAAAPATAPAPSISSVRPAASAPAAAPVRHLTAKVSAVHQSGDHLVVTLDDGNVWEQSAETTSQLTLRPGDVVQLDREMGGWFLSNRYGDTLQVRLRQAPAR
jgi:hypothetical protein